MASYILYLFPFTLRIIILKENHKIKFPPFMLKRLGYIYYILSFFVLFSVLHILYPQAAHRRKMPARCNDRVYYNHFRVITITIPVLLRLDR